MLIEIPMVDPKSQTLSLRKPTELSANVSDPWNWWNSFRLHADFNSKIFISLELSADVPSEEEIKRWLGEPVANIIIPAEIFIRNAQNFPVLSKGHQAVLRAFHRFNVSFLIKCNSEDRGLRNYSSYIQHLCEKSTVVDPMKGFEIENIESHEM